MSQSNSPEPNAPSFRGIELIVAGLVYPLILFQVVRIAIQAKALWTRAAATLGASVVLLSLCLFALVLAAALGHTLFRYARSKPHLSMTLDTGQGVGSKGLLLDCFIYGIAIALIVLPMELIPFTERSLGSQVAGIVTVGSLILGLGLAMWRSRNPGCMKAHRD
jgi:hypothetical protein